MISVSLPFTVRKNSTVAIGIATGTTYVMYGIVTENVNDGSAGRMFIMLILLPSSLGILADVCDNIMASVVVM
jgi:hypothetical protein